MLIVYPPAVRRRAAKRGEGRVLGEIGGRTVFADDTLLDVVVSTGAGLTMTTSMFDGLAARADVAELKWLLETTREEGSHSAARTVAAAAAPAFLLRDEALQLVDDVIAGRAPRRPAADVGTDVTEARRACLAALTALDEARAALDTASAAAWVARTA